MTTFLNTPKARNLGLLDFYNLIPRETVEGCVKFKTKDDAGNNYTHHIDFLMDIIKDSVVRNGLIYRDDIIMPVLQKYVNDSHLNISLEDYENFHLYFNSLWKFLMNTETKNVHTVNGLDKILKRCIDACEEFHTEVTRDAREEAGVGYVKESHIPPSVRRLEHEIEKEVRDKGKWYPTPCERPFAKFYDARGPVREETWKEIKHNIINLEDDLEDCNKEYPENNHIGPGSISWFCHHGICLGNLI